ncbi:MAG: ATP-dependent RecD-like DNA helicase [Bacilli bacterium]|nr:ATP-dependent RecD-like DNA helicase [Bacilli bacterium]
MNYIKGKIKKIIYQNNESGYIVALFRVKETNDKELLDKVNKTVTITGTFTEANIEITMTLYGAYIFNERFGHQFVVERYEIEMPTTKDAIVEFLASSFIDSCGEKTAKKIVDLFGENSLEIIKEDQNNLMKVVGMTPIRAAKIYNSLINYSKSSDAIIKLQNLGFSIEECSKIYNKFKDRIDAILADDFYDIKEVVDFNKVDSIYITNYSADTLVRILACILESMSILSHSQGDTFYYKEEIVTILAKNFNIVLESEDLDEKLAILEKEKKIVILDRRYYLTEYHEKEVNIAKALKVIDSFNPRKVTKLDEKLENLENRIGISYNDDQKKAIKSALNNNITIISGGPGTGKTTIINAIVKLYIEDRKLGPTDILETIALLAPTGRASKKMSTSTNLPASTIHRYLKWYKDSNDFYYNAMNKTAHKLIIVDEVSMIDVDLFNALLNGLSPNIKLILVGDIFQLPSVGPGLVLNDLIDSDYFNFVPLNQIYRQSNNSYIPFLAKEIKNVDLSEEFMTKKDDYSFFSVASPQIKSMIEQVIKISQAKNIDEKRMQILAPMYRGENGIDNLNIALQQMYNPPDDSKNEITYGDIIYRESDKVLQLVNDLDNNVFNGDIGYIESIHGNAVTIDFEGNKVNYEKKDLKQIKHAYAITIHKSQGSEFEHVIMPICRSYFKMLYNKLIYTGVSRAKKSLTIIGDASSFVSAVKNNYSMYRKTSLKERILEVYNKVN